MASIAKHRHSGDGGYPRGAETRARIVAAAIRLFAERGFEGASTRDIATSAGVNAPALQYYFDSKEGVYIACVEHIVSRVWEMMAEVVDRAEKALQENVSDAELIEAFCEIQTQFAQFISTTITSQEVADWRLLMARQQAGLEPTAGFQIAYQKISQRIFGVTAAIVGRLLGRPADDDETMIRTMALNGQLLVFQVMRRTALTTLKWKGIDAEQLALLKRVITEQTRTLLSELSATRAVSQVRNRSRAVPVAGARSRAPRERKQAV
jgi:AcrR family transcriptional regulator